MFYCWLIFPFVDVLTVGTKDALIFGIATGISMDLLITLVVVVNGICMSH